MSINRGPKCETYRSDRVITSEICQMSRTMVFDLMQMYKYLSTRIDGTSFQALNASILEMHLERSMVDQSLLIKLRNILDAKSYDMIEIICHIVLMMPLSCYATPTRYVVIDKLNKMISDLWNRFSGLEPYVIKIEYKSEVEKFNVELTEIFRHLTSPDTTMYMNQLCIKDIVLMGAIGELDGDSVPKPFANWDSNDDENAPPSDFVHVYKRLQEQESDDEEIVDTNRIVLSIMNEEAVDALLKKMVETNPYHFPNTEVAKTKCTEYLSFCNESDYVDGDDEEKDLIRKGQYDNESKFPSIVDFCIAQKISYKKRTSNSSNNNESTNDEGEMATYNILNISPDVNCLKSEFGVQQCKPGSYNKAITSRVIGSDPNLDWSSLGDSEKMSYYRASKSRDVMNFCSKLSAVRRNLLMDYVSAFKSSTIHNNMEFENIEIQRSDFMCRGFYMNMQYDPENLENHADDCSRFNGKGSVKYFDGDFIPLLYHCVNYTLLFMADMYCRFTPDGFFDKYIVWMNRVSSLSGHPRRDSTNDCIDLLFPPIITTSISDLKTTLYHNMFFGSSLSSYVFSSISDEEDDSNSSPSSFKHVNINELIGHLKTRSNYTVSVTSPIIKTTTVTHSGFSDMLKTKHFLDAYDNKLKRSSLMLHDLPPFIKATPKLLYDSVKSMNQSMDSLLPSTDIDSSFDVEQPTETSMSVSSSSCLISTGDIVVLRNHNGIGLHSDLLRKDLYDMTNLSPSVSCPVFDWNALSMDIVGNGRFIEQLSLGDNKKHIYLCRFENDPITQLLCIVESYKNGRMVDPSIINKCLEKSFNSSSAFEILSSLQSPNLSYLILKARERCGLKLTTDDEVNVKNFEEKMISNEDDILLLNGSDNDISSYKKRMLQIQRNLNFQPVANIGVELDDEDQYIACPDFEIIKSIIVEQVVFATSNVIKALSSFVLFRLPPESSDELTNDLILNNYELRDIYDAIVSNDPSGESSEITDIDILISYSMKYEMSINKELFVHGIKNLLTSFDEISESIVQLFTSKISSDDSQVIDMAKKFYEMGNTLIPYITEIMSNHTKLKEAVEFVHDRNTYQSRCDKIRILESSGSSSPSSSSAMDNINSISVATKLSSTSVSKSNMVSSSYSHTPTMSRKIFDDDENGGLLFFGNEMEFDGEMHPETTDMAIKLFIEARMISGKIEEIISDIENKRSCIDIHDDDDHDMDTSRFISSTSSISKLSDDEKYLRERMIYTNVPSIKLIIDFIKHAARGNMALSSILGELPEFEKIVFEQLRFEDAESMNNGDNVIMNNLHDLYSKISDACSDFGTCDDDIHYFLRIILSSVHDEEVLMIDDNISNILSMYRENYGCGIHEHEWFETYLYMRRLLCNMWYADRIELFMRSSDYEDESLQDITNIIKRNRRKLRDGDYVNHKTAVENGITMAPLSQCRIPSMMSCDGPMYKTLQSFYMTLKSCASISNVIAIMNDTKGMQLNVIKNTVQRQESFIRESSMSSHHSNFYDTIYGLFDRNELTMKSWIIHKYNMMQEVDKESSDIFNMSTISAMGVSMMNKLSNSQNALESLASGASSLIKDTKGFLSSVDPSVSRFRPLLRVLSCAINASMRMQWVVEKNSKSNNNDDAIRTCIDSLDQIISLDYSPMGISSSLSQLFFIPRSLSNVDKEQAGVNTEDMIAMGKQFFSLISRGVNTSGIDLGSTINQAISSLTSSDQNDGDIGGDLIKGFTDKSNNASLNLLKMFMCLDVNQNEGDDNRDYENHLCLD